MKVIRLLPIAITLAIVLISCKKANNEPINLTEIGIPELQELYETGRLSTVEVVQYYINRIDSIDKSGPELNSLIIVNPDALAIAEQLDKERASGMVRGPMHGVPVLLKDNIDTHDKMPCTAGSRALMNSFPKQDSHMAKKLREAGAVILGKTNLSEWANFRASNSSSGWSGVGGQTKNPYLLSRNPCGSSSGSGVAVSANLCVVALGTETNGSIVCPSSANGIVGIKPTVGLLSRSGIIPISETQDTPGPMARTVSDAAICLGTLTGVDSGDTKTLNAEHFQLRDYTPFLNKDGLKGKRIAVYTQPLGKSKVVDSLFNLAVLQIEKLGAEIVVELPLLYDTLVLKSSLHVMLYEFKNGVNAYLKNLNDAVAVKTLDDIIAFNKSDSVELKYFDQKLLIRANKMGDLNSEEYQNALKNLLQSSRTNGIDKIMDEYDLDAIISPTGSPAWKTDMENGDNFLLSSSSSAAISGYPNITLPMGFADELPVGISIFGRQWSEALLIEIAYAYEQATHHRRTPSYISE